NLENPDYVKRFVRGRYLVSKPGEQVFILPSKNDKDGEE
ncbi:MAG: septum formation initiator, partial [Longicatena sp.]